MKTYRRCFRLRNQSSCVQRVDWKMRNMHRENVLVQTLGLLGRDYRIGLDRTGAPLNLRIMGHIKHNDWLSRRMNPKMEKCNFGSVRSGGVVFILRHSESLRVGYFA